MNTELFVTGSRENLDIELGIFPHQLERKNALKEKVLDTLDVAKLSFQLLVGDMGLKLVIPFFNGMDSEGPFPVQRFIRSLQPENLCSSSVGAVVDLVLYPLRFSVEAVSSALPLMIKDTNLTPELLAPPVEEVVFRVAIQEGILRRAPKALIGKYFPGNESLVDHKVARVARVLLSSWIFALAHTERWETSYGTTGQFASGLVMATAVELKGCHVKTLASTTLAHSVFNLIVLAATID